MEMGGHDMAPHTPPGRLGRPDMASHTLPGRLGRPDMALHSPPGGSGRPGSAGAPLDFVDTPRYSRMVSKLNLQPTGVSAFTTLKPDMVS